MKKFQGWTPEKNKLYDEAFAQAFKIAEQEYLEHKKQQALEKKSKYLSKKINRSAEQKSAKTVKQ